MPSDNQPEQALPYIDPAIGETLVEADLTVYNRYFGISVILPGDTWLYELENLGLFETDFPVLDELASTTYGEGSLVYSLVDMALDRGGSGNYCRVVMAVENIEGVESLEDFVVILSRRLVLTSVNTDYQIFFEGSRQVTMDTVSYQLLTFTETQAGQDTYTYEVYARELQDAFLTVVLFYNADELGGTGQAVGHSYLETGIAYLA